MYKTNSNINRKRLQLTSLLVAVLFFAATAANAQDAKTSPPVYMGVEVDALPYITGGYYGSVWVSHRHMRYRAIVTEVKTPAFLLKDGFTNNKIAAYTLIADYFFKPQPEQWWMGAGFEYWKGSIQTDAKLSTAKYDNTIFTVGGGYVWKVYNNFYLNPWTAVHFRIAGDNEVPVDGEVFKPSLVTPEVSVKIGWFFNVKK